MHLLLIALGVWVEKDNRRVLQIFWLRALLLGIHVLLHLLTSHHFFGVKRNEHGVDKFAVLGFDVKLSSVKVLNHHLIKLIQRMEHIFEADSTAA